MRKVWQNYLSESPTIKVFLLYGKGTSFKRESYDLVYDEIEENYNPGMIKKTIKAMKYIYDTLSFDFFIRTNISTFWNFMMLLRNLNHLPSTSCYSGDGRLLENGVFAGFQDAYLSGTDTIVNAYMVKQFIDLENNINLIVPEDHAMGLIFNGILKAPFRKSKIKFMEKIPDNDSIIIEEIFHGISIGADHYRVKNFYDRNKIDPKVFKHLLQIIYGKTMTDL